MNKRKAMTLVELLVVITIIALVALLGLGAMAGIMADAKAARTRSQIERIDAVLSRRWEAAYRRPLPLRLTRQNAGPPVRVDENGDPDPSGRYFAIPAGLTADLAAHQARMQAARLQLLREEMPDRMTDVPSGDYFGRIASTWTPQHQGAECLYMILANTTEHGRNALDFFNENEVGDVDGDGMREILDGWGRPIELLRWAPGLNTTPGLDGAWGVAGADDNGDGITDNSDDYGADDSIDAESIVSNEQDPGELRYFVYSAGRDGQYNHVADIVAGVAVTADDDRAGLRLDYGLAGPWAVPDGQRPGMPYFANACDDIHNH